AFADADAPGHGIAEVALVVGEREVRAHRRQPGVRTHLEILGRRVRAHGLARVELPVGVPDVLELREGVDEFLAVHDVEQGRPRLSVTVLTGDRAVVVGDQLRGTGEELTPLPQALGRVEDEGDAAVEAPLPEMTVERGLIVELLEQAAEVPQVIADPFHRYGGVLPSGVGLTHARNMRGRTQPCFAYLPQLL